MEQSEKPDPERKKEPENLYGEKQYIILEEQQPYRPYTAEDIRRYRSGEMPEAEMHALETMALEDPFLADALEGFETHPVNLNADMQELSQRLSERIEEENKNKLAPVVPIKRYWLRAAIAVAVIAIFGVAAYQFLWQSPEKPMARQEQQSNENIPEPEKADSISERTGENSSANTTIRENTEIIVKENEIADQQRTRSSQKKTPPAREALVAPIATEEKEDVVAAMPQKKDTPSSAVLVKDLQGRVAGISAPRQNQLRGTVVDAENRPLQGVVVQLQKEKTTSITDSSGQFTIPSSDSAAMASISMLGFQPGRARLSSDANRNIIQLQGESQAMEEVVVVGYGRMKKRNVTGSVTQQIKTAPLEASPVDGWPAYMQYIKENKRLTAPAGKTISTTVSFHVKSSGKLTRFRIRQSAGKTFDKEALRLIKSGPAWKTEDGKTGETRVIVTF